MSNLPDKLRNDVEKSLKLRSTDKIIKFLRSGNMKLTMIEHNMLDRFDVIDNLLREGKSSRYISRLMKLKFGMSATQTSRDIIDTKEIYGAVRTINKDYYLTFLMDSIISSIRMAKDEGPGKLKEKNMAEKNLISLLAMIEDVESAATIKNFIINITSDPESIGLKRIENIEEKIKKYLKKPKTMDIEAETVNPIEDE